MVYYKAQDSKKSPTKKQQKLVYGPVCPESATPRTSPSLNGWRLTNQPAPLAVGPVRIPRYKK